MVYSLSHRKTHSVKNGLRIWNLFITIVWWNIFVQFFVSLQFLTRVDNNIMEGTSKAIQILRDSFSTTLLIVSCFAFLLWLIDNFILGKIRMKHSLVTSLFFQIISFLIVFSLMSLLIGVYYYSMVKGVQFVDVIYLMDSFTINHTALYLLIIGLLIKFSLVFTFEVQKRLGYGMFWKFVIGHYKKPKEENRIFLFIDLVSSTATSEQLGHVRYSEFLQDCFYIMGNTIMKTWGFVYQYVGDEAVISWDANNPQSFFRAIDFLHLFNEDLKQKEEQFLKKYGMLPKFTASLNSGKIMVAEVGYAKNEIAYHGSVLNTTSRLQKQCKNYGAELLATENFIIQLKNLNGDYTCEFLDEVQFSGKKEKEKIFKIEKI